MFAAASGLVPLAARACRQIVPPVVATLIAGGLISAYNRAFSGHLQQPRMSALHQVNAAADTAAPITTVVMNKPPAPPAPVVIETITIYEEAIAPERLAEKDSGEEVGKDQVTVKLAADPALTAVPVRTAAAAPRVEPRTEPRAEAHRVASFEPAPPVMHAPVPVIVAVPPAVTAAPPALVIAGVPQRPQPQPPPLLQQPPYTPPPVIVGSAPMVTVPDRPNARPIEEAHVQPPSPPAQGPIGKFVHAMKPSTWFAAAREFGDKIEAAGNDMLPSIRQ